MFVSRDHCISCGSRDLSEVAGGTFSDIRSFIDSDPWGENPMPLLEGHRWSLVRCQCGQMFHRLVLSDYWNEVRFSRWMSGEAIREFEELHPHESAHAHVQHILRLIDMRVRRLLDFGCGFGEFLEMARLFGLDAIGVDRSNARRGGAGVEIHADLEEAPGTYDAITMFEVLEHLDDPLEIATRLHERLNPGGVMIVETPDCTGVTGITSEREFRLIHPLDHINAFTPESLVSIMARAGFDPLHKSAAFVTTSLSRVAKDSVRSRIKRPTTQLYFRTRS
jgi:2-polyprenyl-3-methyl-5-hydroxy-6-metoxy-1,4-benzoquinol methylase